MRKLGVTNRTQMAMLVTQILSADPLSKPVEETITLQVSQENEFAMERFDEILTRLDIGIAKERSMMNALLLKLRSPHATE